MKRHVHSLLGCAALAGAAGLAACGAAPGAADGSAGASGATSGGDDGLDLGTGASSGGGVSSGDACATAAAKAETIPATMYIMFDKSGSMLDDQKWAGAKAALIAFFQSTDSAGLRVALRFFPDDSPTPGCNETTCSIDACAQPLVDAGELTAEPSYDDPQQKALVEAVKSRSPGGQTPMYAALGGAEKWAVAYAATAPAGSATTVVLVTDGQPSGCNEDIGEIAALAKGGYDAAGVLTYALGMEGSNEAQIDQIASAGHTGGGIFIGSGSAQSELLAALKKIQKTQVACTYAVPESDKVGVDVDPHLVNVNVTPGGGKPSTLGQVASAASCGSGGGWYYDDPASPTTITLCPSTCTALQADPGVSVEILLGCKTVVN